MATLIGNNQIKLNNGQVVTATENGWFDGQNFSKGQLGAPGVKISEGVGQGQKVSNEVIAQTNPANVQFIDSQIKANQIQPPVSVPTSSGSTGQMVSSLTQEAQVAKDNLDKLLQKQKADNAAKLAELQKTQDATLTSMKDLTTPFREDLEKTQRETLHINENFDANQKLISELDTLLTEGNDLIKQQKEVTGLAAIRNPRIQKTMDDVASRAAVIQAVLSARNGQIATAENLIDRSISSITADRQDRLGYYQTILTLNNNKMINLDADQVKIANEEIASAKSFLDSAQKNADYFKQLLINPTTASLMGAAGVKLTDTPEQVSSKLATASYNQEVSDLNNKMVLAGYSSVYDPSTVSANLLTTVTDSKGNKYYYKNTAKATATDSSDAYLKKLTEGSSSTTAVVKSTGVSSAGLKPPQFSPAKGVGAVYQDPTTGVFWKYTASGWQLM
jgi:hypothetical protein